MLTQSASQVAPAILSAGLLLVLWLGVNRLWLSGTGGDADALQESANEDSETAEIDADDDVGSDTSEKYSTEDLQSMSSSEFREVVAEAYRTQGYRADVKSHYSPVDVMARAGSEQIGVTAKRNESGNKVSPSVIDDALADATDAGADRAAVVTSSTFTESAREEGEDRNVDVVDVKQLLQWI